MLDRIVKHKSYLEGLQYKAYEDQRYGNQDANILEISKDVSILLPKFMRNAFGNNITMEVQALNRGEIVIKIIQGKNVVLEVTFNQDKVAHIQWNAHSYSNTQLEEAYHTIRLGIETLVNNN